MEFEEDKPRATSQAITANEFDVGALILHIEGFEGPINLLLKLAREQKVDLLHVSILDLADQYLDFISQASRLNLEVAADYLVMAAWLAYLKSRLLIPQTEDEEEPSAPVLAEALRFHLQRLQSMQQAAEQLWSRPRLNKSVFARGYVQDHQDCAHVTQLDSLYDLLYVYGKLRQKGERPSLKIVDLDLYSVEEAMARLDKMLGSHKNWQDLFAFLPSGVARGVQYRSSVASFLSASLELAREGKLELQQSSAFSPLYVRKAK